jgi:translation initiation factor RLI1
VFENKVKRHVALLVALFRQMAIPRTTNKKDNYFEGTVVGVQRGVRDLMKARDERGMMDRYSKEMDLEHVLDREVQDLSGGELQRFSGSAAKVMKRWVINHMKRTIFLVEHDFVMAASMADRAVVYEGNPGVECYALPPTSVAEGFNHFLKNLDVTFRRDPVNLRPRINKKNSRLDNAQKKAGEYYLFEVEEDVDDDDL